MFTAGDPVMYGVHGVCRILETEVRRVNKRKIEYYVLEPVDQPGARFYIPTQNEAAVSKLRKVLSPGELDELLRSEEIWQNVWIEDEGQRKRRYRELLANGDRAQLLSMVRALYRHRKEQEAAGRKFHQCDESFLREAEKVIRSEISTVMDIGQNQVKGYVQTHAKTDRKIE